MIINKTGKLILRSALLFVFSLAVFGTTSTAGTLYAGTASANITPETPIPMTGYRSRTAPYEAIHDSLYVRALMLSDAVQKAVIVTVDVIGFSHSAWTEMSDRISAETGIPKEYIMIAPAHNHNGPDVMVYTRDPSPEVLAYNKKLRNTIVETVLSAAKSLEPVEVSTGWGECLMNINRRARNAKGEILLGRNPYGPCDHKIGVARLEKRNGDPAAILINWPCHAVVMGPENLQISGDWSGAAARYVEQTVGGGTIAQILVGASGDINPIYGPHMDFVSAYRFYSYAVDAIGVDLGTRALAALEDETPLAAGSLRALQRVIRLPKKNDAPKYQIPEIDGDSDLTVRLTVIRAGQLVFVGVSGELFNEIGSSIREKSPYRNTFIVTHCNGSSGYLVTDKAYEEGGYEVVSTRVRKGAEGLIVGEALAMINELESME